MADIFDLLLAGGLVFLSIEILRMRDLLVSIVLFIIFGMLVSITWVQLRAADIALVEAVIGSALTGALFLGTLGKIEYQERIGPKSSSDEGGDMESSRWIVTGLALCVCFTMIVSIIVLPKFFSGLSHQVARVLPQSGVENPVTAVVLNFRGYDTLLEIAVLLLAVIAVFTLEAAVPLSGHVPTSRESRLLNVFLHLLSPLMVIVAAYLLWVGSKAPGGAFQAGAMLAGVGILMLLVGGIFKFISNNFLLKTAYVIGFAVFLTVGLFAMGQGNNFLQYPQPHAKTLILIIEIAATLSIAVILVTLFAACSGFLNDAKNKDQGASGQL